MVGSFLKRIGVPKELRSTLCLWEVRFLRTVRILKVSAFFSRMPSVRLQSGPRPFPLCIHPLPSSHSIPLHRCTLPDSQMHVLILFTDFQNGYILLELVFQGK
ncbi:hypothetical protein HMI54_008925 [Coelomomyces lativittatus]|nr:hypothetical protein HMI54_008925 [Coelomomyces lativittatus]KAJ1502674.1 hypothetical protein HMI55_002790 [Coelomomyces lativittatus]